MNGALMTVAAISGLAYDARMDREVSAAPPDDIDRVLETVLGAYRMRVEITADVRYCGRWLEREPKTEHGQFHLVTEGECWVSGPELATPMRLGKGDLIVFPSGARHLLSSHPDDAWTPDETLQPEDTGLLCGELEFLSGRGNPIFTALPGHFVIRGEESGTEFRQLADLLVSSGGHRWGQQVVQNKLADSLFTIAVCEYVRRAEQPRGLLAALVDARLAKALTAVHERPGEDWMIQSMANAAGMSRTSFAELFTQVVGLPPIQYLAQWRANEARRLLKNRSFSVAAVAESLGYRSEAAFRRFFKRIEGVGPGRLRKRDGEDV